MITEKLGTAGDHPRLYGFDVYYETDISPYLERYERARQSAQRKIPIIILPVGLTIVVFVSLSELIGYLLIPGVLVNVLIFYCLRFPITVIQKAHAEFIAEKVCEFFDLKYNSEPETRYIQWFQSLGLLPDDVDETIDDDISGEINGVSVALQDVKLELSGSDQPVNPAFQGLVVIAKFPKSFNGITVITRREFVPTYIRDFFHSDQRVKLEYSEFDEHFEAFTTDQVECRYLLTPTFMERLVKVSNRFGRRVQVAFDEDRLLMTIETHRPWFELDWHLSDLTDPIATIRSVHDFLSVFDIVEDLSLSAKTSV